MTTTSDVPSTVRSRYGRGAEKSGIGTVSPCPNDRAPRRLLCVFPLRRHAGRTLVHRNGVVRIQTDMRIGTRTDKEEHFAEKVPKVESILTERVMTQAEEMRPKKIQ